MKDKYKMVCRIFNLCSASATHCKQLTRVPGTDRVLFRTHLPYLENNPLN